MATLEEACTLSASQMAFFADDELMTIIPSEPLPALSLLSVCLQLHGSLPCSCEEAVTDALGCPWCAQCEGHVWAFRAGRGDASSPLARCALASARSMHYRTPEMALGRTLGEGQQRSRTHHTRYRGRTMAFALPLARNREPHPLSVRFCLLSLLSLFSSPSSTQ